MKKLLKTYIVPHAPVLIPEIGQNDNYFCQKTVNAMLSMADEIAELKPKRIVIVGPHGVVFSDAISTYYKKNLKANFDSYAIRSLNSRYSCDLAFIDKLAMLSNKADITIAKIDDIMAEHFNASADLDHGNSIPLHFINKKYQDFEIVSITYGLLPVSELYEFGMILRQSIESSDKSTVVLASGDLSHCLSNANQHIYKENAQKFDDMVMNTLLKNKPYDFLTYSVKSKDLAQTCAYQSLCIMYGLFEKSFYKSKIMSYEAPFGVGYLVASLDEVDGISPAILASLLDWENSVYDNIRETEDDYIRLARDSIEFYVLNKKTPFWDRKDYDIKFEQAACFVSIKGDGGLRGCIGTIEAKKKDVFQEIVSNAILACSEDDRFDKVDEYELDELIISVDILSELEPVNSLSELSPEKYGIVIVSGEKQGVLLPDLEGINSVAKQIAIALDRAEIDTGERYSIYRFTVERHEVEY